MELCASGTAPVTVTASTVLPAALAVGLAGLAGPPALGASAGGWVWAHAPPGGPAIALAARLGDRDRRDGQQADQERSGASEHRLIPSGMAVRRNCGACANVAWVLPAAEGPSWRYRSADAGRSRGRKRRWPGR